MTRFKEDLERILGINRDSASAESLEETGGIPSQRGIGSQNSNGTITSISGSSDDSAEEDASGNEDQKQQDDQTAATKPNANDTDSLIRGRTDGVYNADDLIDGTAGPTTLQTQGIFEGGTTESALAGINATDCDSGKSLTIRVDGLHSPPAATYYDDGSLKTPAWDSPDEPPEKIGYQDGFYWDDAASGTATVSYFPVPEDSAASIVAYLNANPAGTDVPPYNITGLSQSTSSRWLLDLEVDDGLGGTRSLTLQINSGSCPAPDADPAACPASAPTYSTWPEDDTISLTYENGLFTTNQYDADATVQYTGQDRSAIPFCMDGGRFGMIRAGRDGGTVIYETTTANGAPDPNGTIRYYAADGTVAGFGDSASLDTWLPPSN